MQVDLRGRTALVTGSTSGIGYATAAGLLSAGATVIVNGRSPDRVSETVERLGSADRVRGVAGDVATAAGCAELRAQLPQIDILVNNAGAATAIPVLDISDDEWEHPFALNVMSGVRLTRDLLPGMLDAGWGRVVFVSSDAALNIPTEMVHYGVTKLAQLGIARGYAEAAAGSRVTVNSVLPGPTRTPAREAFIDAVVGDEADTPEQAGEIFIRKLRPTSLIGRVAEPAEVANLIVYLCSEQSSATTGTQVRVDGGVTRTVV
jgi:NAD(P)-dependent dehydrogenase (short-subunit alcohol dehydrogenase family)